MKSFNLHPAIIDLVEIGVFKRTLTDRLNNTNL